MEMWSYIAGDLTKSPTSLKITLCDQSLWSNHQGADEVVLKQKLLNKKNHFSGAFSIYPKVFESQTLQYN